MPRHARLDISGALHHVMIRGLNKSAIFADDNDRQRFLEKLIDSVIKTKSLIYAFALMDNHVHLLIRSGAEGLSTLMRKQLTWYAIYFNKRHGRTGHLFENRYKSILCQEDAYLLTLVRYIHLNPVRAGIVKDMHSLDRFRWCGHSLIIKKDELPWFDKNLILNQFSTSYKKAVIGYHNFVEEGFTMGRKPELVGGGLVRSLGGWSKVLSLKGRERYKSDERILGNSHFVQEVLKEADERLRRQLKTIASGKTIDNIIDEECSKGNINPNELRNRAVRKHITLCRAKVALRAIAELGLSAAEIARNLGVTTSTITRAIKRLEKREKI